MHTPLAHIAVFCISAMTPCIEGHNTKIGVNFDKLAINLISIFHTKTNKRQKPGHALFYHRFISIIVLAKSLLHLQLLNLDKIVQFFPPLFT